MSKNTNHEAMLQKVVDKARTDASFRSKLVASPASAIEQVTGKRLPADYKIVVNDQTDENTLFINIPTTVNPDSMELSDKQLEAVAGGIRWGWPIYTPPYIPPVPRW